jgi:hypothetical protein
MILMRQRQKLWAAKQAEQSRSTATAVADSSGKDVTESSGIDGTSTGNLESLNANDLTRTHETSEATPSTQAESVIDVLPVRDTNLESTLLETIAIPTVTKPMDGAPDTESPIGDSINPLVPSTGVLNTNETEDSNPVPDSNISADQTDQIAAAAEKALQDLQSSEVEEAYEFPDVDGDGGRERDQDAHNNNLFLVESLEGMGFPRRWCEIALDICGDDPEEALNYILTNGISLDEVTNALDRADNEREGGEGGESGGDR